MTAIDRLIDELGLDPEARPTKRLVHRLQSERESIIRCLEQAQSYLERVHDAIEDDELWLSQAIAEASLLGFTGVGTRWAEAQGRMAQIHGLIQGAGA